MVWSILMQDWLDCCRTTIVNSLQAGIVGLPNVGKVRATHSQPDSHDVDSLANMLRGVSIRAAIPVLQTLNDIHVLPN